MEKTLDSYHQHVDELKKVMANFEKRDLNFQKDRFKHLDQVSSGPINLKIPFVVKETNTLKILSQSLQDHDRVEINNLKAAFEASTDESITVLEATLRTLSKRMDGLVVDKNYELVIDLHRLLLPLIPPPPKIIETSNVKKDKKHQIEEEPGFWKTLSNLNPKDKTDPQLFLKLRSDQLKSISDELGKLSQYFWESKFRVQDFSLKPDELIFVLNVEIFLFQLIEKRKEVLEKALELKFTLNSEEQSFLAMWSSKFFSLFYNNYNLIDAFFIHVNYFCLGENPQHYQLYQKIKMFYKWGINNKCSVFYDSIYFDNMQIEILSNQCKALLVSKRDIPTLISNKELDQLLCSYVHRPSQMNEIAIPSLYANGVSNQLMLRSLLIRDPLEPANLLQSYLGDINKLKNKINEYDRLEIGFANGWLYTQISKKKYSAGIVSRSFKPGDSLPVALKNDVRVNNEPIKNLLGNPRKDINRAFDSYLHGGLNNESTKLNESLSSDSIHPIEEYLLKTMEGQKFHKDTLPIYISTYQSIYEIFDDILQKPWILETLLTNKNNEESLESYKRIYGIIYIPDLLLKALEGSCEFFISHSAPLKCLLEKLREEKKTRPFTFLVYLTHTITHHIKNLVEKTKDNKLKKKLQELQLVWPDAEAKSSDLGLSYFEEGYNLWKKETSITKKLDASAYLLSIFSNDKNALMPGEIAALKNKETILQVMELGHLIAIGKNGMNIPVLGLRAFLWIKEYFSVYVDKLEKETREYVLNGFVRNQVGSVSSTLQWVRVQDSSLKWKKERIVVDLLTMQILRYNKNEVKGFEILLPSEITHHPDYKLLFGNNTFRAILTPGVGDKFKYDFTDSFGHAYRIIYKRSNGAVVIERLIVSIDGNSEWARFNHLESISKVHTIPRLGLFERYLKSIPGVDLMKKNFNSALMAKNKDKKHSSLESQLLGSGLWVYLERSKSAVIYLGKNTGRKSQIELQIELDDKRRIITARTRDGMQAVNDVENKVSQALSCLPREQILFLKNPKSNDVSEIHFLNQEISLKRSQNNTWIISGDSQLEGAEWVMGPDRGIQTNSLLQGQGINIEEVGLTVRQRGQTTLLLWPHPLKGKQNLKKHFEFEKQYQIHPPLKIRISDEGEVYSSSGGFLELAYHFAIKKDYSKAVRYLERARVSKVESKEELLMLKDIEMQFKNLSRTSARSSIIYLKALLVLRQIYQEQTKGIDFSGGKWKSHLADSQQINHAFMTYEGQLLHTPFELKAHYFERQQSDVFLTASELKEIKSIQKVILAPYLGNAVKIHLEKFQLPVPSAAEAGMILPFLLMSMEKPIKDPRILLQSIELTEEKIIQHFFELYNLIIKEKITPDQLQPLFGPILNLQNPYLASQESGSSEGLFSSELKLDIARRILLKVATDNIQQKEVNSAFDLSLLLQVKNQIPDSEYALLFSAGKASFKGWRAKGNSQRTLDLAQTSEALLWRKLEELKTKLQSGSCDYAYMGLEGFTNLREIASQDSDTISSEKSVDLKKFNQALKENKTLFGPIITPFLADILVQNNFVEGFISFEKLIAFADEKLKVNLFEILHEQEIKKRVKFYESEIEKLPKNIEFPLVDNQVQFDKKDFSPLAENDPLN